MAEDHFHLADRTKKPYVVLVDPVSGQAAAYNRQLRLVADTVSKELLQFALAHHTLSEPWHDEVDALWARERPSWASASLDGCTLYWLRDGKSTEQHLRQTPDR